MIDTRNRVLSHLTGRKHLLLAVVLWFVLAPLPLITGFQIFEYRVFDLVSTILPPAPVDSRIILVGIDEPSFAELGLQWPWPREIHGALIDSLSSSGATVIALDIVFAEPSNSESDQTLAAAIRKAEHIVLAADLTVEENRHVSQLIRIEPLDMLQAAGAVSGIAAVTLDRDGVLRRLPAYNDGFSFTVLQAWQKANNRQQTKAPAKNQLIQFFGPAHSYPYVSYYQALNPDTFLPPDIFKNRIVIVGRSVKNTPDPGARQADTFATPFTQSSGSLMAGAEVHATILDNLRLDLAVKPVPRLLQQLLTILVLVLALFLFKGWQPRRSGMTVLVLMGLIMTGSFVLLRTGRIWLPPILPLLAVFLSYVGEGGIAFLKVRLERSQIKQAFSRYLSPSLVEQLAADPSRLKLGGEIRCMSIMFCDVRGFTTLSEQYRDDPEALIQIMNRFFTAMTGVILELGGTVDKYVGDCIMAFWNAPLEDPDHALRACSAALAMVECLERLNVEFSQEMTTDDIEPVRLNIGIGINTGSCVVGNMGSQQRFDYSVLGDTVNLASRLEGQTKTYGVSILIGPQTAEAVSELFPLELDKIVVKGKAEAVRIFGLIPANQFAGDAATHRFVTGHCKFIEAYRRRAWQEAKTLLEECRREVPGLDAFYTIYASRIETYESCPPPDDWNGVVIARTK